MTELDDVMEGLALEHGYDPAKAREYYLRTRKLKGRLVKSAKGIDNPFKSRTIDRSGPVFQQGKGVVKSKALAAEREERVAMAQRKLDQARSQAKKLPPAKRSAVEKKIAALEKKLNKVRNVKNPFGNAKVTGPKNPFGNTKVTGPKNPFAGAKISRK